MLRRAATTVCVALLAVNLAAPSGLVLCLGEDDHLALEMAGPGGCADPRAVDKLEEEYDDCVGHCTDAPIGLLAQGIAAASKSEDTPDGDTPTVFVLLPAPTIDLAASVRVDSFGRRRTVPLHDDSRHTIVILC